METPPFRLYDITFWFRGMTYRSSADKVEAPSPDKAAEKAAKTFKPKEGETIDEFVAIVRRRLGGRVYRSGDRFTFAPDGSVLAGPGRYF